MKIKNRKKIYEGGNAVAITLLVLSIAVLAGVLVLYFIGRSEPIKPMPLAIEKKDNATTVSGAKEQKENLRDGWLTYKNEEYDFSMQLPAGWIVETGTLKTGDPAITFYKARIKNGTTTVYGPNDDVTHVSVYPLGVAGEGLSGKTKHSKVIIATPQASAKDYILKSGKAWATKGEFDIHPDSWNDSGFIFARTVVEEEEIKYMRGDKEIEQYEFDPFTGDYVERSGFVNSQVRSVEEEILKSFSFTKKNSNGVTFIDDLIKLKSPKKNDVISSPVVINGDARGVWYFEGVFPVRLESDGGKIIAETYATALGDWMTNDYVPFELSVAFDVTTATSGRLVLTSGSTSVSNKNEMVIPVLFNTE